MAVCTPSSTARTTASIRSGGTWRAAWYISLVRNDSVALAPEPAAVGLCWVSVMAAPRMSARYSDRASWAGPAIPEWSRAIVADAVGGRPDVQVAIGPRPGRSSLLARLF